jgi:hypothetical protein
MAPKKAAAAGPTAQDIEAEWQKKEQAWQREEAQLAYFVKLQQEDARVLRMRSRELSVDVESFASRTTFLEQKSVELRIQAKKVTKELSEQHAREVEALAAQDVLLEDLNASVQTSRTDLVALNTNFETAVTQNADKVKAVAFRNSGIAGLREKVAKLRNERAHLISELEDAQRLVVNGYQDPRVAPFQSKPYHCIVVAESTSASWSFVEHILMAQYQFDISRIDPAEIVFDCAWLPSGGHQEGRDGLASSSSSSPAAAHSHHWSDRATSEHSSSSLLNVLSYGEPQRTLLSSEQSGGTKGRWSPATQIIRLLHDTLYAASRDEQGEQSIVVCMSATLDTSAAANPLDAITFRCQGNVTSQRSTESTDSDSEAVSAQSAIVPLRDVLHVILGGRQQPPRPSGQSGDPAAVVVVEVTAPDLSERYIVVAGTHAEPTILHIPEQCVPESTTAAPSEDKPSSTKAGDVLVGGRSPASSSVVGAQLLQLLQDEIQNSGNSMSTNEFCQRLSMRVLCSNASASCRPVPEWLQALSLRDPVNTDANPTAIPFLPKPLLCAPVSSNENQLLLTFFARDFLRTFSTSTAAAGATGSAIQAAQMQQRHQQQSKLEEYCVAALKAEVSASMFTITSCAFVAPTIEGNATAAPLPTQPDLRQDVYYYFRSNDLSPQQLTTEVESVMGHSFRARYGAALATDEDRNVVLGQPHHAGGGIAGIRVSCVAEGLTTSGSATGHEDSEIACRWCILRFSAVHTPTSVSSSTSGARPRNTIASAFSMPTTLRGSDLQETLALSSHRAKQHEDGQYGGASSLSITTIVERILLADLATHHVAAVPLIPVQCVIATTRDVAALCTHFETRTINIHSDTAASHVEVAIAPALRPHSAPLTHLASAQFCDALHWRRVCHSSIAQQPVVLIVTARRSETSGVDNNGSDNGGSAPHPSTVGWNRGPRDRATAIPLLDAQHHELQLAYAALHGAHTTTDSDEGRFLIPRRILRTAVNYHVSLSDLECSKEEREAIMRSSSTSEAAVDPSRCEATTTLSMENKRRIWRNIMTMFPPSVAQFLTSVSYPCIVVSSPATIVLAEQQTYHALVVPRSLGTMRSRTQPDCLFRSCDIALAMELYFQHILCTDATDARKGAASVNALSPSRHSKIDAVDRSAASTLAATQKQQEDIADIFPSTWFPV